MHYNARGLVVGYCLGVINRFLLGIEKLDCLCAALRLNLPLSVVLAFGNMVNLFIGVVVSV